MYKIEIKNQFGLSPVAVEIKEFDTISCDLTRDRIKSNPHPYQGLLFVNGNAFKGFPTPIRYFG